MNIRKCLVASAALHALFFAKLSCGGNGIGGKDGSEAGNGESIKITVISKSDRSEGGHDQCESAFAGIGISYDLFERGAVTDVFAGYPAHRAGIQIGDRIIGDPADIRGKPGTPVRVRVERGGTELVFDMIRERICTVEP